MTSVQLVIAEQGGVEYTARVICFSEQSGWWVRLGSESELFVVVFVLVG